MKQMNVICCVCQRLVRVQMIGEKIGYKLVLLIKIEENTVIDSQWVRTHYNDCKEWRKSASVKKKKCSLQMI